MFQLAFMLGLRFGSQIFDGIDALERPAVTPAARPYRIAAFYFFAATGILAIPAAVIHTIIGECQAFDVFGFGAITTLGLCILCGIRYGRLNRPEFVILDDNDEPQAK